MTKKTARQKAHGDLGSGVGVILHQALGVPVWSESDLDAALGGLA